MCLSATDWMLKKSVNIESRDCSLIFGIRRSILGECQQPIDNHLMYCDNLSSMIEETSLRVTVVGDRWSRWDSLVYKFLCKLKRQGEPSSTRFDVDTETEKASILPRWYVEIRPRTPRYGFTTEVGYPNLSPYSIFKILSLCELRRRPIRLNAVSSTIVLN
ncbi:hypothetical protein J6590_013465 [Homalodisca vitripennis]|nr:hypothetical protein J6590_013465 [Homalodisca vitripennis]